MRRKKRKIRRTPSASTSSKESSLFFQPELKIGPADDAYEREADAVANTVMHHTNDTSLQRMCVENEEEQEVQRKETSSLQSTAPSIVQEVVNSGGGKPLDDRTRSVMEEQFGYNFSNVKIHDDPVAAKSAASINAAAYTSGNNVVFNQGQYAPETSNGKKLLAHELTHVIQQGGDGNSSKKNIRKKPKGIIQRSLQGYVDAMNLKPEADYGKAAKHLNGESKETIAYILNNNLKGATVIKAKLYEGGKNEPGVGPCSNICRMTEQYYLTLNPTAPKFDYSTCIAPTTTTTPTTPSTTNTPTTTPQTATETPQPTPEIEKPVNHENPLEMSACGFTQLYKECADAYASCEKVKEHCDDNYPTAEKKDQLHKEFVDKAKDNESSYPEAAKNLQHFLGGSGTNKQIPKSLFEKHASLLGALSTHRDKFIAGAEKRIREGQRGTFTMNYLSAANGFGYSDLGLAVGGYTVCSIVFDNTDAASTADFTVSKPIDWDFFDFGKPNKRQPDGTYYDKDGKMHMGPGPKW